MKGIPRLWCDRARHVLFCPTQNQYTFPSDTGMASRISHYACGRGRPAAKTAAPKGGYWRQPVKGVQACQ